MIAAFLARQADILAPVKIDDQRGITEAGQPFREADLQIRAAHDRRKDDHSGQRAGAPRADEHAFEFPVRDRASLDAHAASSNLDA
jgi:hypothetical protein